ncbi:MAG: ExbD/TolR family protein [Armatimonadota bacterium]
MSLSRSLKKPIEPKVEINIVPLVDVALVLLIIFMVTTTFEKTAGMKMQLPTSETAQQVPTEKQEIVIGIAADGTFNYKGAHIGDDALAVVLRGEAASQGVDTRVTVQGDKRSAHGRVVQAMTLAQKAGFSKLVISTKLDLPNEQ